MDTGIEAMRAARHELDEVVDEIRAVPGYEDFLAAPRFADVGALATADQPLVYFAAADLGGLALVVRGAEVDVEHVPLAGLTADILRDRVGRHLAVYEAYRRDPRTGRTAWRLALDEIGAWLWDVALGPVVNSLGETPRAVFVPGGLLGLLPLHAAWFPDAEGPRGRRYTLDTLTVTYVPNARSLAAARRLARTPADRVLTVTDPPHRPDQRPLPFAPVEALLAADVFPPPRDVVHPAQATPERVLDGIRRATVAHLACHGRAQLDAPLDSGVLLADGAVLRLRDLLAVQTTLRLAVLSACETSMPGLELPDEVVSLPTGLLQAGVGGVVASLWAVPDLSTALLMTEFYRRWRKEEADPPDALRAAQLWLRDTSNVQKLDDLAVWVEDGWLPREPVEVLGDAVFGRGADDDSHIQEWAGFAYVGA